VATLKKNDIIYGLLIVFFSVVLAAVFSRKNGKSELRIIEFGPKSIPSDFRAGSKEFAIWLLVPSITNSSRVIANHQPLISVVSESDKVITAVVPMELLSTNLESSIEIQVLDKPSQRKSNVVEIKRD